MISNGSVANGQRGLFRRAVFCPRSGVALAWMGLALLAALSAHAEKLPLERLFSAPDLSGPSLRGVKISPDGKLIAYLRAREDDKDRFDLWAFDVREARDRLLVDSRTLAGADLALSADEEARRERQRTSAYSGIVEYSFAPDSRHLLIPLNGDLYVYDLARKPADAVRRLTTSAGYETDARFSPRSHFVSFVRDQNLYVIDLASGRERAVTREGGGLVSFGVAEFIAQEEMDRDTGYWWSPDERYIALARVDESPVAEVERFEIQASGARVVHQRYPATGTRNARVDLFVADLAAESRLQLDLGADADIYLPRVDWFPDSRGIAVQRESRDQKTLELLRFEALSGRGRVLLTERSESWVPLHRELTFLSLRSQFIWASSRDGFQHLYLYGNDGKLIRQLTSGEFMVVAESPEPAIRAVDERTRRVYFTANLPSPVEHQLYWVSLDQPGAPKRVTRGAGWHSVAMSTDARVFVDTYSNANTPRSVSLRTVDGRLLSPMLPNTLDATHPYAAFLDEHVRAEFGTIAAADGQAMQYMLMKPRYLEPGKRYPVLVDVYGGPGVQRVTDSWGNLFHQYLVQHGYVVFALDNRGTGLRGTRFETALGHRLGDIEVQDQVKGVEFLRGLPFVDARRIGVFGWSYGGYMTLMCLMQAPDTFAAGVAGAPVVVRRLPRGAGGAAASRGVPRRRGRGARDRLDAVRHPLHRALSIYPGGECRRLPAQQRARICEGPPAAAAADAWHGRRQRTIRAQHRAHEEAAGPAEAVRSHDVSGRQARARPPERPGTAFALRGRAIFRPGDRRGAPLEFDPAPAGGRATHATFGHDDARRGFTAHLARFLDGLLDRDLHGIREFVAGLFERRGFELECQWQNARRCQELRLARVQHGTRAVGVAVREHRHEAAQRSSLAIREDLFTVELRHV
jgi:dipeptidyl-peptidase-4